MKNSCCVLHNMLYLQIMIKTFNYKGLKRFYDTGSIAGIQSVHRKKLWFQLAALETAMCIEDMDIQGFNLHLLKGKRKGVWSISVSGNWRITFKFKEGNVYLLNYEDYH